MLNESIPDFFSQEQLGIPQQRNRQQVATPTCAATAAATATATTTTPRLEAATLGDIMSSGLLTDACVVSTKSPQDNELLSSDEPSSLSAKYGITHPLDWIALTANGNLQRLFSSYYDAPVLVLVDSCSRRTNIEPMTVSTTNDPHNHDRIDSDTDQIRDQVKSQWLWRDSRNWEVGPMVVFLQVEM
jgi:hypothetical protein